MDGRSEAEVAEYWGARVGSIAPYNYQGRKAPYRPLLLLWAIGRHAAGLPSRVTFREAEEDLIRLMDRYRLGKTLKVTLPFVYLGTNSDIWKVETRDGTDVTQLSEPTKKSRPFLLREGVTGYLAPDFERVLDVPRVRSRVVNALLGRYFPEELHREILEEVNLAHLVLPFRPWYEPGFETTVLLAYEHRCSFCGFDGMFKGSPITIDAAHVKTPSHGGPDDITNGLALCYTHHRLFGHGAMSLDHDLRILVSRRLIVRESVLQTPVMGLIGERIHLPRSGYAPPAADYVDWHYRNLFEGPTARPSARQPA